MTFLEEFMIHFGIGAAMLKTQIEQASFQRGTDITGTLTLQGGEAPQQIESLLVRLQEYRQVGKNETWKTLDQDDVATNVSVVPGESQTYPFTLHIPDTAAIYSSAPSLMYRSRILSEADILWAVNPKGEKEIKILPHAEMLILDAALRSLGFVSEQSEFAPVTNDYEGKVTKTYTSPAALHEQITNATLQARVDNKKVLGCLILNHREVHLRDYVRALKGEDKQEFFIELPRVSLLAEDGKMLAAATFQKILHEALVLPDNPQNWLLRSASRPPDSGDTLLRPAQGNVHGEADTLLRANTKPPPK